LLLVLLVGCKVKISIPCIFNKSASENTVSSTTPEDVDEIVLLKDIRAKKAKWYGNRLLYVTRNGLFKYTPSEGSILISKDIPEAKLGWFDFIPSPDNTKYIMLSAELSENIVEIRDFNGDKLILKLDISKYCKSAGKIYHHVEQAGWIDNETIFLSTKIRLFLINIKNGNEVQVTQECTAVLEKAQPNTEAPYLSWAYNVFKIGDKLYYNSNRELFDPKPKPTSIYSGDWSAESELIKNAELMIAVDDNRFVYRSETEQGDLRTFLYNIQTGQASLITDEYILDLKILRTNDGKLAFMSGNITGNKFKGVIFDPVTLEKQEFDIDKYNIELDPTDHSKVFDKDKNQFGRFIGAVERNGEYVFLYIIDSYCINPERGYTNKILSYSTMSKKGINIKTCEDMDEVFMSISPSGEYVAVEKYRKLTDDEFLLDVVKLNDIISYAD